MGSDDGRSKKKSAKGCLLRCLWCFRTCPHSRRAIGLTLLISSVVFLRDRRLFPAPELVLSDSFTATTRRPLPERCRATAQRFHHCQQHDQSTTTIRVFACHRKWCQNYLFGGHCEPCAGLGDRTRFLLSQVQDNYDLGDDCLPVQLDYPLKDVALLDTAIYQDPAGWWGELGHYRSYHLDPQKRVSQTIELSSRNHHHHHPQYATVSHFFPHGYRLHNHNYDPCLYHILFQPSRRLQKEIDVYNRAIDSHGGPSIGIHYRTGDVASFGIIQTTDSAAAADHRVAEIPEGWHRMWACAQHLAQQLFSGQQVTYFVATDNPAVKQLVVVQQQERANQQPQHPLVVTTTTPPSSYLRGLAGDRSAWLEVHLLASRTALVVNAREQNYTGSAGPISTFALLAQKIGFIHDSHVLQCATDGNTTI